MEVPPPSITYTLDGAKLEPEMELESLGMGSTSNLGLG